MALPARSFVKFGGLAALMLLFSTVTWSFLRIHYDEEGITVGLRDGKVVELLDKVPIIADESSSPPQAPSIQVANSTLDDVRNATLGFQKIFVLSMPTRRDKRDMIALSAEMSGLEIEFVDGPKGSDISTKERPDGWAQKFNTDGTVEGSLGCWRGHMDIYQRMVRDRIQSALVIEDDADWDVMIKSQMAEVARGSQYLQDTNSSSHSPYGDAWWYIATGHCSVSANTKVDQKHWVIDNDPTVPPPTNRSMFFYSPNTKPAALSGENKRLVFGLNAFFCTGSYAVSIRGARKFIYDQEIELNGQTIDMGISALCGREGQGKCLGVYPPVTGIYIAAGDKSKGTDRTPVKDGESRNEKARATRLVYSIRLNLGSLLEGKTTATAQFPGSMLKEIDTATLQYPQGGPVLVKKEEYS